MLFAKPTMVEYGDCMCYWYNCQYLPGICQMVTNTSVVEPKFFFPDPDPTLTLISDPDSNPDPACL
jgi:hypothetical protein